MTSANDIALEILFGTLGVDMRKKKLTGEKVWIIYDGRAWSQDTDDCAVYEAFSSHKEPPDEESEFKGYEGDTLEKVKKTRDEEWPDGVIFEYDEEVQENGDKYIVNQTLIG
jgi:hypothetical protein